MSVCLSVSKGSEGMLPLHVACLHGSQACLEVLLDVMSMSQVKSVDDFGRSALHAAAITGYLCPSVCLSVCLFVSIFTQRRSVAKSVGCFQRRLFVCLFVNAITSERVNIL